MTENRATEVRVNGKFAPGQSGNPGGRSKARAEITELCKDMTPKTIETLEAVLKTGKAADKVAAVRLIWEYAFGRPSQMLNVNLKAIPLREEERRARIKELQAQMEGNDEEERGVE